MAREETVRLGFEVGTGEPVDIPIGHTVACGQSQRAGKTTALQAIVSRSGRRRALAFVTKRGEGAFQGATRLLLRVALEVSRIEVAESVVTVNADGDSLQGRLAILIAVGWFDSVQTGHAAYLELTRRGAKVAKPSVYGALDKLAELGFVTKEKGEGYLAVEGVKDRITRKRA